ncbi:prepilin-type N-terminal cleavage/methylation domain-containing protein [Luteimonas sp. MC1825]|nr:prepilin-type N-terminal cleavage/methylation domain-containing protein [Luteimonas sp. MC1825]QOC89459.1 prepilin-type N-terminal cleavage/methylation domain-containing protein [Luteimonas sp. MC1825]
MRAACGFTLIELMVVVAVVAILVAIAVPSYSEAVRKGKRGQAKSDLVEAAQIAERYKTINSTYTGLSVGTTSADEIPFSQSPKTGTANYIIAVSGTPDASTFKLIATPTGGQAEDRCGVLSIDAAGIKRHSKGNDDQCQFGQVGT